MNILGALEIIETFGDLPGAIVDNLSDASKRTRAKNRSLKQQCKELSDRLGLVEEETRVKFYAKFSIIKKLAWKDGILHDMEKLVIYEYIFNSQDIPNDEKILLMKSIINKPKMQILKSNLFKKKITGEMIFTSIKDATDFKDFLLTLAKADGEFSKDEEKYLNQVFKELSIPN